MAATLKDLREGLHVSVSQIKTYLLCPRKFELGYVRGEAPAFVPVPLAFGSAFHAALAAFYAEIEKDWTLPPVALLQDVFRASWAAAASGPVPLQVTDGEKESPVDLGARMLQAFHEHAELEPLPVVEGVEVPFSVPLHDPETGEVAEERLVGALDLVVVEDGEHVIVEHKTSARKYTRDQLAYDHQPTAYRLAARELGLDARVRYQVVTKTKTVAVQVEDVVRSPANETDFLLTVVRVLKAVEAGVFYPVRGWQCASCPHQMPCSR